MFKQGDKVIPISKSVGCKTDINWDNAQRDGQSFMYFNGYAGKQTSGAHRGKEKYNVCAISVPGRGNHYLLSDLIPYDTSEDTLFEQLVRGQITNEQYEQYKERG